MQCEAKFREIATAASDRNAARKVVLLSVTDEGGGITVQERGRGRRPSISEIAAAKGGDAM